LATGKDISIEHDHGRNTPMICINCYQKLESIEKKGKDLDAAKEEVTSNFYSKPSVFWG
jgi:hypothetical protein